MKKIALMAAAVALSLSVAAFAGRDGGQPKQQTPAPKDKKGGRAVEAQSPKTLADQIAQLKQEHQAAIHELDEIKKLASEEKATKTLGALDKLIARRNRDFQEKLNPLQQRLSKLEAQGKGGDKDKDRPSDVKAKTNGDKGKSKTRGQ